MEEIYFRKIMSIVVLAVLIILSFFLLKPLILSIIFGMILAFIFYPVYNWLNKKTRSKNLSSFLICFSLIIIIALPAWFLTPIAVDQSIKIYLASQQMDFIAPIKSLFPSFFTSETFSAEIGSMIHSFATKTTNKLMNVLSSLILNFPVIFLQSIVVFFTLFFVLRDKDKFIEYIKSLLPFTKDVQKKLFESSKNITSAVIYGQIVIGVIQGVVMGVGFFLFKVPNPFIFTLLAILSGILPIIGVSIVFIPIVIYLLIAGNTFSALGVAFFGILSSSLDNFLRPIIVSKRTQIPSSIVLIGMIGGILLFGILGLILGPLILAYLLIVLELYRNKGSPGILTANP